MAGHRGSVVDIEGRRVRDRDGEWYPLDRMEGAGKTLYYARRMIAPMFGTLFDHFERWLLPEQGWSISRPGWRLDVAPRFDWYIETELITVDAGLWTIADACSTSKSGRALDRALTILTSWQTRSSRDRSASTKRQGCCVRSTDCAMSST